MRLCRFVLRKGKAFPQDSAAEPLATGIGLEWHSLRNAVIIAINSDG